MNNNELNQTGEISLNALIMHIKKNLVFLVSIIIFFLLASIVSSYITPNRYETTSILVSSQDNSSLSSELSSLSSIARFSGVNLPSEGLSSTREALERVKTFSFFSQSFLPNIYKPNLIAVKNWVPEKNKIIYNNKIYNKSIEKWVRNVNYPKKQTPSDQELYKLYLEHISIKEDITSSLITLKVTHQSPYVAYKWSQIIIDNANETMRNEDIKMATNSINYLKSAYEETSLESLRDAISNLLESQLQSLMIASSNENYVFKVIEAPIIPEEKSNFSKIIIIILGTFLGFLLSLVALFIKLYTEIK